MKKMITILLFLAMKSYAGWYEVYSFKGTIDKYPINFYLQIDKEPNERVEKPSKVQGVYSYNSSRTPIYFEGMLENNKVTAYVKDKNKKIEKLSFSLSDKVILGTWKDLINNTSLILKSNEFQSLNDRKENSKFENIEILQSKSFDNYYFIGIYKKNKFDLVSMSSLKIINKKDNKLFQKINFSKYDSAVGGIMTIIFDNIENINKKDNSFYVTNNIGRMGSSFLFKLNKTSKKFELIIVDDTFFDAKGDLNNDGILDGIVVKDENGIKRELQIYLGDKKGNYKLVSTNKHIILDYSDGGGRGDPFQNIIIKNGYFSVEHYGGMAHRWTMITTFKYNSEKKNWFLHKDSYGNFEDKEDLDKVNWKIKTTKDFGKVPFEKYNYKRSY